MSKENSSNKPEKDKIAALEQEVDELRNLSRLLAKFWQGADEFVWTSAQAGMIDIAQYPTVQGTANQMALGRIAEAPIDHKKALSAMRRLDPKGE